MSNSEGFAVWVITSAEMKRQLAWKNWASGTDLGRRVRRAIKEDVKPAVGRYLAEQMLAVKKNSLDVLDWLPVGRQGEHQITTAGFVFTVDLMLAEGGMLITVRSARTVK